MGSPMGVVIHVLVTPAVGHCQGSVTLERGAHKHLAGYSCTGGAGHLRSLQG